MNLQSWAKRSYDKLKGDLTYQEVLTVLTAGIEILADELEQGGHLSVTRLGKLSATRNFPRRIRFSASTAMRQRLKKQG